MRIRIRLLFLAAAGMIAPAGLLTAVGVQPASAATPVSLPISSFYQMAVDAGHGHIFISQGSSSQNGILVTDLTGQVVTTITGQAGVMGIALSPDGSTLYAALSGGDAVTAISTATLTQTASYPLPAGDSPFNVAVQSGKIWVSYNTGTVFQAAVGYFDPSAASPSLQSPANMSGWFTAPQLAADPEDTGVLVAVGTGTSGSGLASYDTAANPVSTLAGSPGSAPVCQEEDVAVAPGGAEFAVACHTNPADNVYSTSSLSLLRSLSGFTYPSFPNAIAYDSAGDVAAGSFNNLFTPDLYTYPQGSATAVNAYDVYSLSTLGGNLEPRGLAWMPDGSQLFGVLQRGTSAALAVIQNPTVPQHDPTSTAVTFCADETVAVGQTATCYAVVTDATPGGTTPTGQVTFTSDTSGGSFSSGSCTLSPLQAFAEAACSVTYTPTQIGAGTQTITANYGGDSHHLASSGQASLVVTPHYTSTDVTCSLDTVAVGQATSCTATVQDNTFSGLTTPTGVVTFTSDTSGGSFSSSSCTLSAGSVSGQAACSFSYTPGEAGSGIQTITASYGGDGTHAASSGQAAIAVTLRVTSTVLACQQVNPVLSKCTATVSDTAGGSATAPTGTVSFTSSGPSVFSATQCTLSASGTSVSSCAVYYATPPGVPMRGQIITASYSGDGTHQDSTGGATLK